MKSESCTLCDCILLNLLNNYYHFTPNISHIEQENQEILENRVPANPES